MFAGSFVGSGREGCCYFHARSKIGTPRLARGSFLIAPSRLARRTSTQRDGGHNTLEYYGTVGKADGVSGFDAAGWLYSFTIEVDSAATDRSRCGGTRLE